MSKITVFIINFFFFAGFSLAIDNVNNKKRKEQINNDEFYHKVLKNKEKRQNWRKFLYDSKTFLTHVKNYPIINLNIAGIELPVYDISKSDYAFLIHTTEFNLNKSQKIKKYFIEQNDDRSKNQIYPNINFDVCPLLSTSVIDPNTGGYTSNCCNAGVELQVHLILDVDERCVNHMGLCDIYSPASSAINAFLHNITNKKNGLGRESMPEYFSKHTEISYSPYEMLNETFQDFNEVVVLGNNYARFFHNGQEIKILAIGISKYWLEKRPSPSKESIEALKELSNLIPIVYYEPETPYRLIDKFMIGKGSLDDFKGYLHRKGMREEVKDEIPSTSGYFGYKHFGDLFTLSKNLLIKYRSSKLEEMYRNLAQEYNNLRSNIDKFDDRNKLTASLKELYRLYDELINFIESQIDDSED